MEPRLSAQRQQVDDLFDPGSTLVGLDNARIYVE